MTVGHPYSSWAISLVQSCQVSRFIGRSPGNIAKYTQSPDLPLLISSLPQKKHFIFFSRFFDLFCRRTSCESSVSHLWYTESAESSRAETTQNAHNRTFLIGQLTGSDYIQWSMETFVRYWVGISLVAFCRRGKCCE